MKVRKRTLRLTSLLTMMLLRWGLGVLFSIIVFMKEGGRSAALFVSIWAIANLFGQICSARLIAWAGKIRENDTGAFSLEGGIIPGRMSVMLLVDAMISLLLARPFAAYLDTTMNREASI